MLAEFEINRPKNIDEALELLATGEYSVIAGGTDVIVSLRDKEILEKRLLDITGLVEELRFIKEEKDCVVIGALSTLSDVFNSKLIKDCAPLLKEAVRNAGSLQIRNRGTIGGNICNASPAADSVPALIALDAVLTLESKNGKRDVRLEEFIPGPYRTSKNNEEIIKYITIKKMNKAAGYSFSKLGRREALAISRMNVAVIIELKSGLISNAVISPGSVMPSPCRITDAENMLLNKEPSEALFSEVAKKVGETMVEKSGVRWSTEYKKPVIETMVKRSITESIKKYDK